MTTGEASARRPPPVRRMAAVMGLLVTIIVVFFVIRLVTDVPQLRGRPSDDDFSQRYVHHPWLGYAHIVPGVVYLLLAPLQLSRRFRTRHYTLHRRLGRVLVALALVSGVFAVVFGTLHAWGGAPESVSAVVFGIWFLVCLVLAVRAIRDGRVAQHRRWMIRAFAVGVGVGTIRIWVGIFTGLQIAMFGSDHTFPYRGTFGIAFPLALVLHVAVGEWWLRRTPALDG